MTKKKSVKKTKKIRKVSRVKKARKSRPKITKIKRTKTTKAQTKKVSGKLIGEIVHFYDNILVGVVKLKDSLNVGDRIKVEGHGKSFMQNVNSMQVEHKSIKTARKGQEIGLKVSSPVKRKDLVYKA
ncbi:MAG: hypothetical protein AABW58_00570 [Nanoarchaeota archaeon]